MRGLIATGAGAAGAATGLGAAIVPGGEELAAVIAAAVAAFVQWVLSRWAFPTR